jgi:hypothetical protein
VKSVWAVLFLAVIGTGLAGEPKDTVRAFYSFQTRTPIAGAPTVSELNKIRPWLTPRLWTGLDRARREREAFIKKYGSSEKPPWCEGDLFSSTFEGATSFEIAGGDIQSDSALVQVLFTYRGPDKVPHRWADRVRLRLVNRQWLIDDILYDLPAAFGNTGTLRANLP